jgi:uncharacterized membrane protein YfcA
MSKVWWICVCGVLAGFINGLLGTGGGIILVFALCALNKRQDGKDVFANVLIVTAFLSVISLFVYYMKGSFEVTNSGLVYALSAALGGLLGAFMLDRFNTGVVKKIFVCLVIFAGLNMSGVFK